MSEFGELYAKEIADRQERADEEARIRAIYAAEREAFFAPAREDQRLRAIAQQIFEGVAVMPADLGRSEARRIEQALRDLQAQKEIDDKNVQQFNSLGRGAKNMARLLLARHVKPDYDYTETKVLRVRFWTGTPVTEPIRRIHGWTLQSSAGEISGSGQETSNGYFYLHHRSGTVLTTTGGVIQYSQREPGPLTHTPDLLDPSVSRYDRDTVKTITQHLLQIAFKHEIRPEEL